VSDTDSNDLWEEALAGIPGPDPGMEPFKWGWNGMDGATVWPVGGPGDGWPSHMDQLKAAWGRRPGSRDGDVMGNAEYRPRADEVVVGAFGTAVPDAVVDWFREAFPGATVRVVGGE